MSFKNKQRFLKDFELKLVKNPNKNAMKVMESATRLVMNEAKESVSKKGKGRIYKRGGITHQASAPNDPPATDTGELKNNITMNVLKRGNGQIVGQIISGAPYSEHLEFGTTKMEKRPFLGPALKNNRKRITAKFKKAGMVK